MTSKGKEKETWIILETANLDDKKILNKVQKALCGTPQVRDQIYDTKNNTVRIKVVCCSPNKVMDKLCAKSGYIKALTITDPPKEGEKPKETEKPKEGEKPKPPPAVTTHAYHEPVMGQMIVYNDPYRPYNGLTQQIGYPSRPVHDSWGGGPPPPPPPSHQNYYHGGGSYPNYGGGHNYFSDENSQGCCIM